MAKRGGAAVEPETRVGGYYLYLSVFLSGGSILVVEIAASRVLAPHFGNTLYTWTSMIGIILASLSLGYAAGGRLADRHPSARTFFGLMLVGAGLVALVPPLRAALLPLLESGLTLRSGPVFGGLLLFAAPSCVLAALTPFAVKLSARGTQTLGTVTGNLFTWSTVGSIVGTFATGFVLIPWFGLNAIFLATAGALALVGGFGFHLARAESAGEGGGPLRGWGAVFFAGAALLAGAAWAGHPPGLTKDTIHFRENMYHTIRVLERESDGRRLREMYLDFQPEGAMVVGDDRALHFEYTKFLALGPAAVPQMRRAFFIGGGAFTMPKALHLMRPDVEVAVAELDPDVVAAGRRFFRLGQYPEIRVLVGDGRRSLRRSREKWDFIVGDAYRGLRNIPPHLVTREFFEEVRGQLAPGGAFLLNLIARRTAPGGTLYAAVYRTMAEVFPDVWVFSTDPQRPSVPQNILLFAFPEPEAGRFARLMARLRGDPELRFAAASRVGPPPARVYGPVMTDDYDPVEYLVEMGF